MFYTKSRKVFPALARSNVQRKRIITRFLFYTVLAFIIMLPVRWFVTEPFVVTGNSMSPAFEPNDYLVIDKLHYLYAKPRRDDVVIFRYPLDPSIFYIKRVVGLPGESVEMSDGVVSVTGHDGIRHILGGSHLSPEPGKDQPLTTTVLAADEYFVLGDNRDASSDSRQWGPLQAKFIVGRAFMRILPLPDAGIFPGAQDPSVER